MTTTSMVPGMLLADRYRLEDLLSETHQARFWRGTDTVLGRNVAINVLPSDDPHVPRLLAAARKSATVQDPRLLRVLDCDDSGELTWVINEWGHGVSLDILLQRGPLNPTRAAWLALETATTIQAAHQAGVCHGRLTPESVLVTEAGAVKIIGFAVSASLEGGGADRPGAYGFLEPVEADVIDLAGILYAGLTGKWPGVSPSDVPSAPVDVRGPLRPRQVRHGVPRMLDALCERVLRTGGHEHSVPIGSAIEICAALNDFLGSPLTAAPIDIGHMHEEPEYDAVAYDPDATVLSPAVRSPEDTQAGALDDFHWTPVHTETPAQLPPFEDSAERPLFAKTPRRPALAAEPIAPLPVAEPQPDERASRGSAPHGSPQQYRRGRIALICVLAVALVVAMVLAFRAGSNNEAAPDDSGSSPLTATRVAGPQLVDIVGVRDFDPAGQPPREHPEQVQFAIDEDPATGWRTSTYFRANLGGLKEGVGLVLDLGTQVPVSAVDLRLAGTGDSAVQIRTTPTGVNRPPTSLADLQPAAGHDTVSGEGTVRLEQPQTTRYVVVWLTNLPRVAAGQYRAEVREIQVRR